MQIICWQAVSRQLALNCCSLCFFIISCSLSYFHARYVYCSFHAKEAGRLRFIVPSVLQGCEELSRSLQFLSRVTLNSCRIWILFLADEGNKNQKTSLVEGNEKAAENRTIDSKLSCSTFSITASCTLDPVCIFVLYGHMTLLFTFDRRVFPVMSRGFGRSHGGGAAWYE